MIGGVTVFTDTIASAASTGSGVNLQNGWDHMFLVVPTMSTSAQLSLQASGDDGTTWYSVYHETIQSATVATPQFLIASGLGTGGGITEIPAGLRYVRVVATGTVNNGVIFKIICSD